MNYKGIDIDDGLASTIRHMHGVEEYREVLGRLQAAWDSLSLLGELTGAAAEMSGTREAFQKLTGQLLNQLGRETLSKVVADLRARAQNAIDILTRNLFERTADIGFLADDDEVRDFLMADGAPAEPLQARFREYVAKYSVYSDIVLLAPDGAIRAQLGESPVAVSRAPLVRESLATGAPYVEYFGALDFLPPGNHLVYAHRVCDPRGAALGVLVLVFRLGDEMRGIFRKLAQADGWTVLACVADDGTVIASSSAIQLPVGTELYPAMLAADGQVLAFGGREYLTVACRTHGYQGYMGPGWLGLGLIPVEYAFAAAGQAQAVSVDDGVLEGLMRQPTLFSEELRSIPIQAERIQQDLNRSVWNGSVRQTDGGQGSGSFGKTLLWEISDAGHKTQAVFEESIGNLHQTVIAAILQNCCFRADFAIDVMDRNLYERANDCRWWALNASFRQTLAGAGSAAELARCGEVLACINGLYTVYENLVLFDAAGQVVAVSRDAHRALVGQKLDGDWVRACLALSSSQAYVVSDFAPSRLYGGKPTYIYAAPVRDPAGARTVGGIAIVFDAAPQFAAMLTDALPRDGAGQVVKDAFVVFVDHQGTVLAASDGRFPIGSVFPDHGTTDGARIGILGDTHYALGTASSSGYREYKRSDGYVNALRAICGFPLGKAAAEPATVGRSALAGRNTVRRSSAAQDCVELATFQVGQRWLGIAVEEVVEAIPRGDLTPPTGASDTVIAGYRMYKDQLISIVRLDRLLAGTRISEEAAQIIVVRTRGRACMGLLVDSLGSIPEVPRQDIQAPLEMNATSGVLITGIVRNLTRDWEGDSMLSLLGVDRLCARLGCLGCAKA